jgi:hypothetical protein
MGWITFARELRVTDPIRHAAQRSGYPTEIRPRGLSCSDYADCVFLGFKEDVTKLAFSKVNCPAI